MEHRWSIRKPVTGNVVVECPRIGLIHAAMRDVSLGGMAIKTNSISLPLNAPVTVVFDLFAGERRDPYCLQAMIVRCTADGAAIMFLEPDADVIRSMGSTLYGPSAGSLGRRSGSTVAGNASRVARFGSISD